MKILFDLQAFMWTKYSGIPRYFSELILELRQDSTMDIVLPHSYCMNRSYWDLYPSSSKSFSWKISNILLDTTIKLTHLNPSSVLTSAKRNSIRYLRMGEYDLFHPTFFDPYFLKHLGKKPYVLTIHDLSLELYPEYVPLSTPTTKWTQDLLSSTSAFIADSYATKKLFMDCYDVDSCMIHVVHLGPTFTPSQVKSEHTFPTVHRSGRPYLLFVNQRGGRKNTYACLIAITKLILECDVDIVCAGGGKFTNEELIFFQNHNLADRIFQYTVNDSELIELYKCALAFIFPSVNEGFGIPILESFACGCPVICSNTSCFPEIGGDAAVYFDPKDMKSIREAVYCVMTDNTLREKMRVRGYRRLEKFSWKRCATETKKVYEFVLH